ncbi:UNKNOWN [Stylonychia lemnae]|uniref:Uncharacterized protein n=1 Tax=Stylonychia lemnae TaxID=5949 RepID=A0A078A5C2_STYLE|nr:UNKNOWN [Stylonychia lemnae]|eukprot:CDW77089.1 UNKNOWN [Stylonychia lemnae]
MDYKQRVQNKGSKLPKLGENDKVSVKSSFYIQKQNQNGKVEAITLNNPQAKNILYQNSQNQEDLTDRINGNLRYNENQNDNLDMMSDHLASPLRQYSHQQPITTQLHSNEVFLKNASNMVEVVNKEQPSFAMRMKKNKEINQSYNLSEPDNKLYQANPFPGLVGQDQNTSQLIEDQKQEISKLASPNIRNRNSVHQSSQVLRQSVEKQRANNFGNVSKQILNNKASAITSIQNVQQQPTINISNQKLERQNSYVNKIEQQQNQPNQPIKSSGRVRASSVSNNNPKPQTTQNTNQSHPPRNLIPPKALQKEKSPRVSGQGQVQQNQQQHQSDNLFDMYGQNLKQLQQQAESMNMNQQMSNQVKQNPDIYKQIEQADKHYKDQRKQDENQHQISKDGQTSTYKPYSVKDYKQMQQTSQSMKLGGLGANIGSQEWENAKKKQEQAQEFAKQVKLQNQQKPQTSQSSKKKEEKPKEKTSREKALEFAKNNVPKPKVKSESSTSSNQGEPKENNNNKKLSEDLDGIEEENVDYDELGNTIGMRYQRGNEFEMLNQKHDEYASEIEKIKQMIM